MENIAIDERERESYKKIFNNYIYCGIICT